jgi:hypothetical protein
MKMDDKKMIIRGKGSFAINAKAAITKYLRIAISLALVLTIFYFAVVMSFFLMALFLTLGLISYIVMKFKNNSLGTKKDNTTTK